MSITVIVLSIIATVLILAWLVMVAVFLRSHKDDQ